MERAGKRVERDESEAVHLEEMTTEQIHAVFETRNTDTTSAATWCELCIAVVERLTDCSFERMYSPSSYLIKRYEELIEYLVTDQSFWRFDWTKRYSGILERLRKLDRFHLDVLYVSQRRHAPPGSSRYVSRIPLILEWSIMPSTLIDECTILYLSAIRSKCLFEQVIVPLFAPPGESDASHWSSVVWDAAYFTSTVTVHILDTRQSWEMDAHAPGFVPRKLDDFPRLVQTIHDIPNRVPCSVHDDRIVEDVSYVYQLRAIQDSKTPLDLSVYESLVRLEYIVTAESWNAKDFETDIAGEFNWHFPDIAEIPKSVTVYSIRFDNAEQPMELGITLPSNLRSLTCWNVGRILNSYQYLEHLESIHVAVPSTNDAERVLGFKERSHKYLDLMWQQIRKVTIVACDDGTITPSLRLCHKLKSLAHRCKYLTIDGLYPGTSEIAHRDQLAALVDAVQCMVCVRLHLLGFSDIELESLIPPKGVLIANSESNDEIHDIVGMGKHVT